MAFPFLLLILANLLWGLIPYPVAQLMGDWTVASLVSIRFLIAGVFFTVLAVFATRGLPFRKSSTPIPWPVVGAWLAAREGSFQNLPRWVNFMFTGAIGFALQIALFFLAVKELGAVVSSLGFMVALGTVALVGWITGRERLSILKGLYLAVLFGAAALLAWWAPRTGPLALGPMGLLLALAYGLSLAFFLLTSGERDGDMAPEGEGHPRWPWARLLWKLSILFLSAFMAIVIAMALLRALPTGGPASEAGRFFSEMPRWWALASHPAAILLVVGCTIAPFVLYYRIAVDWRGVSPFSMWAGVLALLEPVVSMAIGVGLLNESYPLSWLVMVTALVFLGILLKWAVEREAHVHVWLLVGTAWGSGTGPWNRLRRLPMVRSVKALAGPHDLFAEVVAPSQPQFDELVRVTVRNIPGVERVEVLYPEDRPRTRPTPVKGAHRG